MKGETVRPMNYFQAVLRSLNNRKRHPPFSMMLLAVVIIVAAVIQITVVIKIVELIGLKRELLSTKRAVTVLVVRLPNSFSICNHKKVLL